MRYKCEPWWHYWYALCARIDALGHWMSGHTIEWYANPEGPITFEDGVSGECVGDIVCRRCPDTGDGSDLAIWCRWRRLR